MADRWFGFTPHEAKEWAKIARDSLAAGIGGFMLIWQTVFVSVPSPLIIGAGLVLLGLPPALRLEDRVHRKQAQEAEDERWSHLP